MIDRASAPGSRRREEADSGRFPLLTDVRSQKALLSTFLAKGLLLLLLFLGLDRALGWVLRRGLDRYYGLDVPAQVLCVGHSHTVLGIDKVALEHDIGVPVAKFAVEGATTPDRLAMIRYYFRRQPSSVRAVVYDVDAHSFTAAGLSSASYQLLFPFIDDREMREYISRNCATRTEYWLRRIICSARFSELTLSFAARGWVQKWTNYKSGTVDVAALRRQITEGRFRRIEFNSDNIDEFEKTARFVSSTGRSLCLAYLPTVDIFNEAEPEKYELAIRMLGDFGRTNSSILFLNYNPEFQGRHELFRDPIHLNREGQREVTARLAADLKRILVKPILGGINARAQSTN